jgi:hypothetical protein
MTSGMFALPNDEMARNVWSVWIVESITNTRSWPATECTYYHGSSDVASLLVSLSEAGDSLPANISTLKPTTKTPTVTNIIIACFPAMIALPS